MSLVSSERPPIVIVSGLPRSGTSMMMKMLEAGGLPIYQDGLRQADDDNPKGYYEAEKVKDLALDASWLPAATGHGVKIVSSLLTYLPLDLRYKVIFMRREMTEILASQQAMLRRSGQPPGEVTDEVMSAKFSIHLRKIAKFLVERNIEVLEVNYGEVLADAAGQAARVGSFLGGFLDEAKMIQVVDKALYRQRS
ncbi:MAG: hypothetical protein PHI06_10880 [Desulfobulbaceae bacterium]|nr:hypothetical protein [Desulfobulbaceae bacterium]